MNQQNMYLDLETRIAYFRLITALLCEPEEDITFNEELYRQLLEVTNTLFPQANTLIVQLKKASGETTKTKLLVEYARLFIGPFKLPTPPYASCYLGSRELNNEITDWVRSFYEDSGLEFDYTIMDLPDHIAVETEFLHYLLTKEYQALMENDKERADWFHERYSTFFQHHHSKWVDVLSKKVIAETMEPFYSVLFQLIYVATTKL